MAVPANFSDLSTTPNSNSGLVSNTTAVSQVDDHIRAIYAMLASIDGNSGMGWSAPYGLATATDRSLKVPESGALADLPAAAARAGFLLGFDDDGLPQLVAPSSGSATDLAVNLASTDSGKGAALIGFIAAGTGATARTVLDKAREVISVLDYGTPTGTNDDAMITAAFAAGAGKRIHFPGGYTYAVSGLTWPANTLFTGDGVTSIIKKRANGDIGSLGALSTVRDLYFDLQGATYTGRCFTVSTGAVDFLSWRKWIGCQFIDSESYAIEFTQALAGYGSLAFDCHFTMAGATPYATPAIKLPTANETNGNRHFIECKSGGFILIDFGGGENTNLTNCLMAPPIYSSTTQKAVITGGRIVNRSDASAWTIDGSETVIVGNSCAQALVTLSATLDEAFIDGNTWAATTFTDNAPGDANDNKVYLPSLTYTPALTGSVSDPVIGNGQIFGIYVRRGEDCRARITLAIGSTTTLGSGYFKFTLPYAPADVVTGTATLIDNSTGTPYSLTAFCPTGGTNELRLVVSGTGYMTGASPIALANGDVLYIDIDYRIA